MITLAEAINLREKFLAFIEDKEIKKELKKDAEKEKIGEINDRFVDWFLFEKIHQDGKSTREKFAEKNNLNEAESECLNLWSDFVYGIFKVKKEEKDSLVLLNLVNNQKYTVAKTNEKQLEKGSYFISRLIPYDSENYLFAPPIFLLKVMSNDQIHNLVAQFELDYPYAAFVDNQQKMNLSYKIQEKEYQDFVDFFGSDEIIVEGQEITQRLQEFYHFRYFQNKDKSSGKTIAKIFREKYGTFPELPIIELPESILSCSEVGILYDKVEGLNFLPWYGVFRKIFSSVDFQEIPGYDQCVLEYLKSDSISTLPFRKVLQYSPENTVEVFKNVLKKKKFEIPSDYNKIMLKYKKALLGKSTKPSVIPMPERTKALLRTKKPEEYSSLHFYEGPNHFRDFVKIYDLS